MKTELSQKLESKMLEMLIVKSYPSSCYHCCQRFPSPPPQYANHLGKRFVVSAEKLTLHYVFRGRTVALKAHMAHHLFSLGAGSRVWSTPYGLFPGTATYEPSAAAYGKKLLKPLLRLKKISNCYFAENGQKINEVRKYTSRAIVLLVKPFKLFLADRFAIDFVVCSIYRNKTASRTTMQLVP